MYERCWRCAQGASDDTDGSIDADGVEDESVAFGGSYGYGVDAGSGDGDDDDDDHCGGADGDNDSLDD